MNKKQIFALHDLMNKMDVQSAMLRTKWDTYHYVNVGPNECQLAADGNPFTRYEREEVAIEEEYADSIKSQG